MFFKSSKTAFSLGNNLLFLNASVLQALEDHSSLPLPSRGNFFAIEESSTDKLLPCPLDTRNCFFSRQSSPSGDFSFFFKLKHIIKGIIQPSLQNRFLVADDAVKAYCCMGYTVFDTSTVCVILAGLEHGRRLKRCPNWRRK